MYLLYYYYYFMSILSKFPAHFVPHTFRICASETLQTHTYQQKKKKIDLVFGALNFPAQGT